ncbi:hypothetical protein CIPAW_10G082500 [Carya illinoinensis]|uniref:Acetyl-CoA C-acetyltransferase n=1 Tax=Carya illinoinensis TaxID=32201 RepID=A0A8T1PC16_CARIL|nr:hypothetical protein CIPAW_10G082500 [Carya illinoinensis]
MAPVPVASSESIKPRDVCIVGVARTPMGGLLGTLSSLSATKLGSIAIELLCSLKRLCVTLKRANVDPSTVEEVFFGSVLSANLEQAPARQAALGAGIPHSVICTTINKVCSSGMKAKMLAAQSIQFGLNNVIVAGGMESMSNAPKYLAEARFYGLPLGCRNSVCSFYRAIANQDNNHFPCMNIWSSNVPLNAAFLVWTTALGKILTMGNQWKCLIIVIDWCCTCRKSFETMDHLLLHYGLWDVYNDFGMAACAEICADHHTITRRAGTDNYAVKSFQRGISAQNGGLFAWEIVPVEISGGRGKPSTIVDKDKGLGKFDAAKLRKLRPSFMEDGGSVTAGNTSSISDGAAVLVLVGGEKALQLGLKAPELFTTAPALAIPKAISNAGLEASQICYYEINEAFSVVALANQKLLGLNPERLNAHGGAVSLGHPLGCSGAPTLVTLLGVLRHKNGKYGVAGICNGGGGASALVLELMPVAQVGLSKL